MNGSLVRKRLLELGMSREQLAANIGVSIATVWNMMRGHKVNESNLHKAARALGVDVADLQRPEKQETA